jgi:hypothetical protein
VCYRQAVQLRQEEEQALSRKLLEQAKRRQEELQEKRDRRNKSAKRKKCESEEDAPPPEGVFFELVRCINRIAQSKGWGRGCLMLLLSALSALFIAFFMHLKSRPP